MTQSWIWRTSRTFRANCRVMQALIGWMLMAVCISTQAVGPTNEEESLADLNSGFFPLSISPDGEWRVHVDEHGVLHRVSLTNPNQSTEITVPITVRAMSVSSTADVVAITDGNCVGLITFTQDANTQPATSTKNNALLRWLQVNSLPKPTECSYLSSPPKDSDSKHVQGPGSRYYGASSIAISRAGKYVAVSGNPIQILEIESGRVAFKVPTGAHAVLHTRFIDNDKKLLVVQAILGEQWESPAEGSDMQFAVWDLQSKTLFSFHNTQTTGTLTSYDFLWSFSDKTGELWAVNTNGQYWESANKRMPIRPYSINLKQCNSAHKHELSLPSEQSWLGFAADPLGRWVAIVEENFHAASKLAASRLVVRSSQDGHVLIQWPLNIQIRSLAAAPDGDRLYATTSGQPDASQMQYTGVARSFEGGGAVLEFDLERALKGPAHEPIAEWPTKRCMIEDEDSQARDISIDNRSRPLLFSFPIAETPSMRMLPSGAPTCSGDVTTFFNDLARSWGGNKERLWIDRGSALEQISLVDGRVEKKIPTPRSPTRCSIPLFEQEQFLSWEGDAVTLRPFADAGLPQEDRVLVKKPGWFASSVTWFGDRFGVRWIKTNSPAKAAEDENDARDEGEAKGPDGSALAVLYDQASGEVLKQVEGFVSDNQTHFGEDDEGGADPFAYDRPVGTHNVKSDSPTFEWSMSYSGSIRARMPNAIPAERRTVLWDGFNLDAPWTEPDPAGGSLGIALGLGGSMGALIKRDEVVLFDAEKRQRFTGFSINDAVAAKWYPSHKILVVGVYQTVKQKNGFERVPMLHAYGLDEPQNLLGRISAIENAFGRISSAAINSFLDQGFGATKYVIDMGYSAFKHVKYSLSIYEWVAFLFLFVSLLALIYIKVQKKRR